MTEDDAKAKWCPFARVADAGSGSWVVANRLSIPDDFTVTEGTPQNPPAARCIGADCMAWRWTVAPLPALHSDFPATGGGTVNIKMRDAVPGKGGFCGLAGQPVAKVDRR